MRQKSQCPGSRLVLSLQNKYIFSCFLANPKGYVLHRQRCFLELVFLDLETGPRLLRS